MPGTAADRQDDEVRALREEIHQLKLVMARADERLARLDGAHADLKSSPVDIATLRSQMTGLISLCRWAGSIFGLATVYGILAASSRLSVDETEIKGIDSRIGFVEKQEKDGSDRLRTLEFQNKEIDGRLSVNEALHNDLNLQVGEVKRDLGRLPSETPAELDERIKRIARIIVDDATRPPSSPRPAP